MIRAVTPYIVHIDDLPETEGTYPPPFDAEKLTIYRDLGRASGTQRIGCGHERLLPGRRSSFTHAHAKEEEAVFVVAGTCHVRLVEPGREPREVPLRAGHFVAFPAGTGIAHTFVNHGTEECVLLVLGERRADDTFFYPEDAAYDAFHAETRPDRHWTRGPVRAAVESDTPTLLAFLQRKAAFDRELGSDGRLVTSEERIRQSMFGTTPYAFALLAERDGAAVGLALYYFRYSSFRGQPNLWLDDLFVLDEARSAGAGTALMTELLAIARRHACSHLGWTASARNTRAIAFYERLGAHIAERLGPQVRFQLPL